MSMTTPLYKDGKPKEYCSYCNEPIIDEQCEMIKTKRGKTNYFHCKCARKMLTEGMLHG